MYCTFQVIAACSQLNWVSYVDLALMFVFFHTFQVTTFGCNDEGALGRPTSEEGSETEPGDVTLSDKIVQLSAGDSHTAALTETGQVFLWGTFRVGFTSFLIFVFCFVVKRFIIIFFIIHASFSICSTVIRYCTAAYRTCPS